MLKKKKYNNLNLSANHSLTLQIQPFFKDVELEWRNLLPISHHLISNDLIALENTNPSAIYFRYVNIYRQKELIGVIYLQHLNFNKNHFNNDLLNKPLLKTIKPIFLKLSTNILVCGNLFRVNFQGFYFKNKEDRSLIFECLRLYTKQVKKETKFCGILVKDCSRVFKLEDASSKAFMPFTQDLTMVLAIRSEWHTLENYVDALSKKYKQRAKKILKAIQPIKRRNLTLEEVIEHKDKIEELYLQITYKQNIALGILNSNYFIEMKKLLAHNFEVIGYFENNFLIAYSCHIFYPDKKEMEIHYIGFDNEKNREYSLYFNIIFNGLETALKNKYTKLELGRTAREAKASVGAYAVENYNYIWIKQGPARWAVNFLTNRFSENMGEDWKNRNPFK